MSATKTRIGILDALELEMPDVDWRPGRLPDTFVHKTQICGAVYTQREEQAPNDQYITYTHAVQVFMPVTPTTNNTRVVLRDQDDIEALVDTVISAVKPIAEGGSSFWYIRPIRVDYLPDPNLQPTRAEITFMSYDGSIWQ